MRQKFRSGAGPDQGWLMPPDPRDWLPAGHLAWKVIEQVGEMDLSGFGARYRADGQGGRPYDPAMMVTLALYCYCRGRRSSREMEMATWDDVGARVICGGLHPDHSTIAEFIGRHFEAVCGLLPESVRACAREGLVSLDLVAGDGTKLKANASMASNRTAAQLDAEIAELEAQIDGEFRRWAQGMLDAEDAGGPPGPGGGDEDGAPDGPGDGAAPAGPAGEGGGKKEGRKSRGARGRCWRPAAPPARNWTPGRTGTRGNSRTGPRSSPPGWRGRKPPSPNGRRRRPPGSPSAPAGRPPGRRSAAPAPSPASARTGT